METAYAIIGGGITGASIAYHLSERTDDPITVFEGKPALADGKTARSNAIFRLTGSPELREMKRYGLGLYNELLEDPRGNHATDVFYERYDRIEVATTQSTAEDLRDAADDDVSRYVPPEEIRERIILPELRADAVRGARWYPDVIRFDPRLLAMEFVERARDNGVTFQTNTTVTDVHVDRGRVTGIESTQGPVDTDVVVSAAGAQNASIAESAGVDLPQRHDVGVFVTIEPQTTLGHSFPNLKHAETGVFYTGRPDGTIIVGRSGGGYADNRRRDSDQLPERVREPIRTELEETAEAIAPMLRTDAVRVVDEWVGLACKTPDGNPIVGRTDRDGFAVAAYHSQGIQLAPAVGRILATQLVEDRSSHDVPAVDVSRFRDHEDYAVR